MSAANEMEAIDHPPHYQAANDPEGHYEAIRIIEATGLGRAFCLGNALKYLLRAGNKPGEPERRDLEKARWYIERRLQQIRDDEDGKTEKRKP